MNLNATAAHATHEPTLHCPNCNHEIKLTESLAAPLIEETRRRFQEQLANKDAEVAKKTEVLRSLERKFGGHFVRDVDGFGIGPDDLRFRYNAEFRSRPGSVGPFNSCAHEALPTPARHPGWPAP
ncbi:hypothetical protein NLM33_37110 [Bradyrhizobium sp. CCGUVB1N3]|uniref:hypothetical protein n=1 Tax=Bradyrhizobium sp. CCGUVB1N3 TaxID=2949629 RepID=UPI0020B4323D|nr:hypothetical protein [Bradyrhizobium sp. CCGUVB1N3]MCP3475869.1 hypothetical protein [Bradyrhizobium sp. CCGUVB1N3]